MNNSQIKSKIESILKQDDRLWNDDKTELNQTLLLDLIDKIDENIINLLLQDNGLREKFFIKIKDVYVFKTNDFKFFMEENKVDNSFTQYKNQIGLTDGKRFIKDTNDVVLDFPYKDCVLEGGQSTEEGIDNYYEYSEKDSKYEEKQAKRKEIFFNQILAKDEIDRLFDEKAFVNWKRFTKDGEQEVSEIKRDDNGIIRENIIIKGNNLLALHSLKKQYAGKVKLIYIDPPYNTGNDEFKYNDRFNHSTWLAFMKNRLEIAKDLLKDNGFIVVQCDDYEQAYLKVLLDNIFKRFNFRNSIYWHRTYAGKTVSKNLPWNVDVIHLFSKTISPNLNNVTSQLTKKDISSYKKDDNDGRGKYTTVSLQKTGGPGPLTTYDYIDNSGKMWKCPKKGWRMRKEKLKALENDNRLYINGNTIREKYYLRERQKIGKQIDNFWLDIGNLNRQSDIGSGVTGQKPEGLLKRIIELTTNNNDIVLDYHLGSGTTCAVAHKMGRQYIGVEQLDYGKNDSVTRLQNVINGDQTGISKSVNWQGGGNFIYFELAKWNEKAREEVLACNSLEELESLFDTLYEKYFLNYNLKIKEFKEKVIKEDNFLKLSLDEQKRMFLTMLDLNQMYVQKSEMADKRFGISEKDQDLTTNFYNI